MAFFDKKRGASRGIMSNVYVDLDSNLFLCQCCEAGDISNVRKMLRRRYAFDVNQRNGNGHTLLHLASAGGHEDVVELLLRYGADVSLHTSTNVTALHMAVKANDPMTIKRLLVAGANVTECDANGLTPVQHTTHNTEVWNLLSDAECGIMPDLEPYNDKVPIPGHIIPCALIEEEYKKKREEELREKKAKSKKGKK